VFSSSFSFSLSLSQVAWYADCDSDSGSGSDAWLLSLQHRSSMSTMTSRSGPPGWSRAEPRESHDALRWKILQQLEHSDPRYR
jgi:hypothetical protein